MCVIIKKYGIKLCLLVAIGFAAHQPNLLHCLVVPFFIEVPTDYSCTKSSVLMCQLLPDTVSSARYLYQHARITVRYYNQ